MEKLKNDVLKILEESGCHETWKYKYISAVLDFIKNRQTMGVWSGQDMANILGYVEGLVESVISESHDL